MNDLTSTMAAYLMVLESCPHAIQRTALKAMGDYVAEHLAELDALDALDAPNKSQTEGSN